MLACCGPERQLNGGSAQERQRAAEQGCDDNRQCVRARAAEQGRNGGCAQDWGSARRRLHARLGRRGAAALRGSAREKMARGRQRAGAQESAQERGITCQFGKERSEWGNGEANRLGKLCYPMGVNDEQDEEAM